MNRELFLDVSAAISINIPGSIFKFNSVYILSKNDQKEDDGK
jgi:hypothetical protein